MPLRYGSQIAEHEAVRRNVGLFDVSHMAQIRLTGTQVVAGLEWALTGLFADMPVGRAKYSLLCNARGGVVDDLIVYRTGVTDFLVIANAGNRAVVVTELLERCESFDVQVEDVSDAYALLAVQGPRAQELLEDVVTDSSVRPREARYFSCHDVTMEGQVGAWVARTGYTGEDGFEILVAAEHAPHVWDVLLARGGAYGILPCGLAARDSLRLEAGMPLHGAELTPERDPFSAGLHWAVKLTRATGDPHECVGAEALTEASVALESWREQPQNAPVDARILVGLLGNGRRAARTGYDVRTLDGVAVGHITSGVPSPTLGQQIAMAYVHPAVASPGTVLHVDVRGRDEVMEVHPLPLYTRPDRT